MRYSVGSSGSSGDWNSSAYGTAKWMQADEAAALDLFQYRPGTVILGQNSQGQLACLNREGHIIVLAPPRSGKGVGFVQANLIGYQGSMIVTDPKGENAAVTYRHRKTGLGQNVIVLDPTDKLKSYRLQPAIPTHRFNPLSVLESVNYVEVVDDIERLADALLIQKEGEKEQHWRDGARSIMKGLLTFLAFFVEPERRNLITLSRLANGLEAPLPDIFLALTHNTHPDAQLCDVIARTGAWFEHVNPKERASFISVALRSLSWLNSPVWSTHLTASDFHPADLKAGRTTVYIVCPFDKLEDYSPWFRLVLSSCLIAQMRAPKASPLATLYMLDEFAATIGKFATLEQAIPYIEGVGGRFAMVFQTLSQMQTIWPGNEFHGVFASASAHVFFNVGDQFTSEYVSNYIGKHGQMAPSGTSMTMVQRDLLTADEVRRHPERDMIVFLRGYRPAWLSKIDIRHHGGFAGRFDENPAYKLLSQEKAALPTARSPAAVLNMAEALARAKVAAPLDLEGVVDAIDARYPNEKLRFEGEFYGYDDSSVNPETGRSESFFVPVVHIDLLKKLKGS